MQRARPYKSTPFKRPRPSTKLARTKSIQASRNSITAQSVRVGGYAYPSRQGELKFLDVNTGITVGGAAASTFGSGVLLNGLANGNDASSRIGRKVTIKSLYLRWSQLFIAGAGGAGSIRVLIVYDKQANAAAPAITDILLANDFHALTISLTEIASSLSVMFSPTLSPPLVTRVVVEPSRSLSTSRPCSTLARLVLLRISQQALSTCSLRRVVVSPPLRLLTYRSRIRFTDV